MRKRYEIEKIRDNEVYYDQENERIKEWPFFFIFLKKDKTIIMEQFLYGDYIKFMYQKGFYVERYSISLTSYEVLCDYNKIVVLPAPLSIDEEIIMIFTGTAQKAAALSGPTEFRLLLFDTNGKEFRDNDNIMLSVVKIEDKAENVHNLYTREYQSWKFGQTFEKGIEINSEKYLMFQTQKEIGRFDIDITGIDLFRRHNKIDVRDNSRMTWID